MRSLFFVRSILDESQMVVGGDEAHHAITVMRMGIGEEIAISDGAGSWAEGVITSISKKSFTLDITQRGKKVRSTPELIVIQALTKSERIRETIELLVEAGVDRIIPWQSDHSISKWREDMQEKWLTSALTACKQSRRYLPPEIESSITLREIGERFQSQTLLLVLHESAHEKLSDVVSESAQSLKQIVLVIGPEGGISSQELSALEGYEGKIVRLGTPVFRSAHAGIAGLAAVQALMKRW